MKTTHLLSAIVGLLFVCACNKKEKGPDTTAPIMQLLGPDSVYVMKGEMGVDPGATAADNFDGDISAKVTSNWDSIAKLNNMGKNTVTYRVSDKANNLAKLTREVYIDFTAKMPLGKFGTSIERNYYYITPSVLKSTGTSTISNTAFKDQFSLKLQDTTFGGSITEFILIPAKNDFTKMKVTSIYQGNINSYGGSASIDPITNKLNVSYGFGTREMSISMNWTYSLQVQLSN